MDMIRVLLVEDNPLDVRLLREALRGFNGARPTVTNVTRLDDALARLSSEAFDIVLLDLSLPDSEGFDTLVRMRRHIPALPIVVLTGYDDDRFAMRAVQEGAQDYLVKGQMDGNLILRSIRYAIERARVLSELRQSEERYRMLAENVSDVIWTVDLELHFTFVSSAMARMMGYTPEEMTGGSVLDLLSPASIQSVMEFHQRLLGVEKDAMVPFQRHQIEVEARHKNGGIVWAEIAVSPLLDSDNVLLGFTGITRDITERRRNDTIQSIIYGIVEATTASRSLEEMLGEIRNQLGRMIDVTNFYVALYDPASEEYSLPVFWDERDPLPSRSGQLKGGLTDFVRRTGQPVLVDPVAKRQLAEKESLLSIGSSSAIWLGVPLRTSRGVIGVIVVQSYNNPQQYTKRDEELLTIVAGPIAMAVERKSADEEIRAAHRRLESLVQAMPEVVYFKDREGRNLIVNRSFANMVGKTPEEIVGKTDEELFPAELAAQCRESDELTIAERKIRTYEEIMIGPGQKKVYYETVKVPLTADNGDIIGLIGVSRDVTERRMAEESLRTTTSQLKNLFDHLDHVFVSVELNPLQLLQISPACEKLYGLPRQAFFDDVTRLISSVYPDDLPALDAAKDSMLNGLPTTMLIRIIRPDGEIRWVEVDGKPALDANGVPVRVDAVISDVTQRRRGEQVQLVVSKISEAAAMAETLEEFLTIVRNQLSLLFDTTNLFVALHEGEKDVYSFPFFADQYDSFGQSRTALPNSMTDYVRRSGQPILADQAVFDDLERAGRLTLVGTPSRQWMGVPLRTSRGVIGVIAVQSYSEDVVYTLDDLELLTSISGSLASVIEKRRATDALLESEEQLRQAQKMEAIGRLAGGIAHDFNNLLTSILGHSELTLYKLHENDPLRDGIDQVMRAAERAAGLTRQLLAFSRKQVLMPRVLDLNGIVVDMEKMLRRLIGEDISLETALASGLAAVKADPGQLEQVIMNLAVNARDAMPNGGRLLIETANVVLDESYHWQHGDVAPGNYVMLSVSDNGTGIESETLLHIFEPFFTTKEHGKGTGLGLSTVYGIVKQSGGHIWVYSEKGHGTVFKIYLPRVSATVEVAQEPERSEASRGSETILIVEDEEGVRELVRRILEARGYTVIASKLPKEALDMMELRDNPVDLLVTDVIMPQLSGSELAKRIRARNPQTKVLFISGYTDNSFVTGDSLESGQAFLEKPFTAEALAREVRRLLDSPQPAN